MMYQRFGLSILRSIAAFVATGVAAATFAATPNLPSYGADPDQTSVSGLSSGAFMTVQLQVAYSASIVGSGVVAGGPYYCAANKVAFTRICMGLVPFVPPNPALMVSAAKDFAEEGAIDSIDNLSKRRVYIFSGADDSIVRPQAVDATASFFRRVGVPEQNLKYVKHVRAGHALITPAFGNDCAFNGAPYISRCTVGNGGYDQAGDILRHIYGPLRPRADRPTGRIVTFNQREFADARTSMADTAFLYVPNGCTAAGSHCKIHVALHGCAQSAESVGDDFYTDTGYNNWADTNGILVLYPQVNKSAVPANPGGCWDWFGYTGSNYAHKSALQMKAIMAMVDRLAK